MNRLSEEIKAARLKTKLSTKALAKKCGLAEKYIVEIESGRRIAKEKDAEKILTFLGRQLEFVPKEALTEQKVVETKQVEVKEQVNVAPNAQWREVLAGLIREYDVYEGNKVVGTVKFVIENRKILGADPNAITVINCRYDEEKMRIKKGDRLVIEQTKKIVNGRAYLVEYKGDKRIRILRKTANNKIAVSPGISQEDGEVLTASQVKIIGRILQVSYSF